MWYYIVIFVGDKKINFMFWVTVLHLISAKNARVIWNDIRDDIKFVPLKYFKKKIKSNVIAS